MWREGDEQLAKAKTISSVWTCVALGISIILFVVLLESKSRWAPPFMTIPSLFAIIGQFLVESRTTKAIENLRRKVRASKFFSVSLWIRLCNVAIGNDFGYLWAEEGLLCYEGNKASFRLPNTVPSLHGHKKNEFSKDHSLFFQTQSGLEAELTFSCDLGVAMSDAIGKWQTGPVSSELAQMPPQTFQSSDIPKLVQMIMGIELGVFVVGFEWFLWSDPQYKESNLFAMILLAALVGSLGAALAWQARKRSALQHYLDSLPHLGGSEGAGVA